MGRMGLPGTDETNTVGMGECGPAVQTLYTLSSSSTT